MRRRWVPRFKIVDLVVIVLYAVPFGTIAGWVVFYAGNPVSSVVPDIIVLLAGVIVLALRRFHPVIVLPAAALATGLALAVSMPPDFVVLPVVIYSVAAWWSPRLGVIGWTGLSVLAAGSSTLLRLVLADPSSVARWQFDLLLIFGVGVPALLVGISVGMRRRYVTSLEDLTEQLAIERDRSAQLATQAERARIAREVHDILSHGLQVIVSSADAASAVLGRDPERATGLLETVSDTGRRSLREARTVFTLLDEPSAPRDSAPQPTLAELPALVERLRTAGLDVRFAEEGRSALDATRELVAYRLTQEAMTNVLRHAGEGVRVVVHIAHTAESTSVDIVDDGPAADSPIDRDTRGSGAGLVGMRQRVQIVSGHLEAGPRTDRAGWRVHAEIPADGGDGGGEA